MKAVIMNTDTYPGRHDTTVPACYNAFLWWVWKNGRANAISKPFPFAGKKAMKTTTTRRKKGNRKRSHIQYGALVQHPDCQCAWHSACQHSPQRQQAAPALGARSAVTRTTHLNQCTEVNGQKTVIIQLNHEPGTISLEWLLCWSLHKAGLSFLSSFKLDRWEIPLPSPRRKNGWGGRRIKMFSMEILEEAARSVPREKGNDSPSRHRRSKT